MPRTRSHTVSRPRSRATVRPAPADPGRAALLLLLPALALVLLAGLWAASAGAAPPPEAGGVELVFLANEGFLLRAGGDAVLIDAFLSQPYKVYGALPPEVDRRLRAGEPPFDRVRLALASHVHPDHFQPAPARVFLAANPTAQLASSAQVLAALGQGWTPPDGVAARLRRVEPAAGGSAALTAGGVRVEVLRLRHTNRRFYDVTNLGHLVHLGGRTVLHVGDAEGRPENFAPYRLNERRLDVAIVPYWYLLSAEGRALVAASLPAAHTVAAHVPPAELAEVRARLAEVAPQVIVFAKALDSRRF